MLWMADVGCLADDGALCDHAPGLERFYSDAWGIDVENHRLQRDTVLKATNVARLKLAWSYGYANQHPRSWPLVTEDTIFIGDSGRGVVALDRATGCTRWVSEHAKEDISSAILHANIGGRVALLVTERTRGLYALDALNGDLIWHAAVDRTPVPFYSGTPLVHGDTVYVPLSSMEVALTLNPLYGCCTTRGGIAAFELQTGNLLWYRPTIEEPARQTGRHWLVVENHGPSGAPVWGAPALEVLSGLLFFGTGQNYSHPTTATSDAIFAVASDTGRVGWVHQFTKGDAYNMACGISGHPNCPKPMGPDLDFGAPPILVQRQDGSRSLIAGQKSGDVRAMDPDTGELLWTTRIGRGGSLGGVHWGMAVDPITETLYVPISDIETTEGARDAQPAPGLYALDLATGSIRWAHEREARCPDRACWGGLSAAITITPELVATGSLDGLLEVLDARDGTVLFRRDTWTTFETVNGVEAAGGAIDAHGPMIADDLLIVSSGYDTFFQKPGNVLLVFRLGPEVSK